MTNRLGKVLFTFSIVSMLLFSCMQSPVQELNIPDGTYKIAESEEEGRSVVKIKCHEDFVEFNEEETSLLVDTSDYVPILLSQAPDTINQDDGRKHLMLTLNNASAEDFADFTERNLGGRVAFVIGGKFVSQHKIRTRIEGGKIQITRCTDNACEKIFYELEDNYGSD